MPNLHCSEGKPGVPYVDFCVCECVHTGKEKDPAGIKSLLPLGSGSQAHPGSGAFSPARAVTTDPLCREARSPIPLWPLSPRV